MIRYLLFIVIKFILGVESGASFSWSAKWQSTKLLQKLPELVDTFLLSLVAIHGYEALGLDVSFGYSLLIYSVVASVVYAGVQSATWMFLRWDYGDKDPNTKRSSTLKPIVDFFAEKFGWKLGDEGYSWVAATMKGTIITLPMGGLGGILFTLGYEIGSHFPEKYKAIASEGLSFVGVGVYAVAFLEITKIIGGGC